MKDQEVLDRLLYTLNRARQAGHNPLALIGALEIARASVIATTATVAPQPEQQSRIVTIDIEAAVSDAPKQ